MFYWMFLSRLTNTPSRVSSPEVKRLTISTPRRLSYSGGGSSKGGRCKNAIAFSSATRRQYKEWPWYKNGGDYCLSLVDLPLPALTYTFLIYHRPELNCAATVIKSEMFDHRQPLLLSVRNVPLNVSYLYIHTNLWTQLLQSYWTDFPETWHSCSVICEVAYVQFFWESAE